MSTSKPASTLLSSSATKFTPSLPVAEEHSEPSATATAAQHASFPSFIPDNDAVDSQANPDRPRPAFNPFFTLVEDATTSEHYHPTVHYIFSDDDTDILTDAALRASSLFSYSKGLPPSPRNNSRPLVSSDGGGGEASESRTSQPSARSSALLQVHEPNATEERYLVVDMGPTGDTVTSVRSFSPNWQALSAEVTKAPTWEQADDVPKPKEEQAAAGLMLRIEGVPSLDYGRNGHWDADGEHIGEDGMVELIELFEKRMTTLRKVVEGVEMGT